MVKKKVKSSKIKSPPLGVKIIAVFNFIMATLIILLAIVLFVKVKGLSEESLKQLLAPFPHLYFILLLGIIFSFLIILLGIYLWKGKNWARIILIIAASMNILSLPLSLLKGSFGLFEFFELISDLLILGYLLFNKNAKQYFSSKNK